MDIDDCMIVVLVGATTKSPPEVMVRAQLTRAVR